ncbi:hypothetical protein BSK49_24405 [Paenibacillus odorifer]|uniref:hypothetical protein n=1 Tax=Paenibacillus odorifer TaxID=189426 RepID=UPI00096CBA6A|nr:hypothetical protein [Paenibacillus odorifer]OMD83431.1 hypothetical protein BSK49_24405 [Paenibacillus odorifer]
MEYTLIPQRNVSEGEKAVLDLIVSGLDFQNLYILCSKKDYAFIFSLDSNEVLAIHYPLIRQDIDKTTFKLNNKERDAVLKVVNKMKLFSDPHNCSIEFDPFRKFDSVEEATIHFKLSTISDEERSEVMVSNMVELLDLIFQVNMFKETRQINSDSEVFNNYNQKLKQILSQ